MKNNGRYFVITLVDSRICMGCPFNDGPREVKCGDEDAELAIKCMRSKCPNWKLEGKRRATEMSEVEDFTGYDV